MSGVSWASLRQTAEDATKPLGDGWYECVVETSEATVASTGSDMVKAVLQVTDGPHSGRKLWTQFVFSPDNPNALIFFFRNMAAFGLGEAFFDGLSARGLDASASMQVIAQTIKDRRISVRTEIRKWQGQDRNNVAELKPSQTGSGGLPGGQPAAGLPGLGGLPGVGAGLPGGGHGVPAGLGGVAATSATPTVPVISEPVQVPVTSSTETSSDSGHTTAPPPELAF